MRGLAPWLLRGIVLLVAGLLGTLWWLLSVEDVLALRLRLVDLLLFLVAATVMERLPIRLADGRAVPTSLAVIGAAVLLGASPWVVTAIAATAYVLACLIGGEQLTPRLVLGRAVGAWALSGAAAVGAALGPMTFSGGVDVGAPAALHLGAAVAVGVGVLVGLPAAESLSRSDAGVRFLWRRVREEIHRNRLVAASVAATAGLGALVHPVLGAWTLPTMLLPLAAARAGLDRLGQGQRAYDQTIRAMSRLPEQLGSVPAGHGVRVAQLARAVAMELGLDAATVAHTVRAAHLHELGRIKLEREVPAPRQDLAVAGGEVLREVGDLDEVAAIVEAQAQVNELPRDGAGLPARIVVACCELDSFAPTSDAPGQRDEVILRLLRGIGDIEVVAALARIVDPAAERQLA